MGGPLQLATPGLFADDRFSGLVGASVANRREVVDNRIDRIEQLQAQIVIIHFEPELLLECGDQFEGGNRCCAHAVAEQRLIIRDICRIHLKLKRSDEDLLDAPSRVLSV